MEPDLMHTSQMAALGKGTVSAGEVQVGDEDRPKGVAWGFTGFPPRVDRVVGRTRQDVEERIVRLENSKRLMRAYIQLKVDEQDNHGAADAAMDLRDIDSELLGLRWVLGE
jgi:hypothetical protein